VHDAPGRRIDGDDVPLVGRLIADVAARSDQHEPAREVQRGRELFALRQERDTDGPAAGLGATGNRELVDESIGRCRVDELAVRVGDRGRVRDPVRTGQGRVPARGETPQDRAGGCVDRERPPVGRRHEEGVVPGPVHRNAAQIDRRGIDRAVEDDALLLELAHVRRRDPSLGRPCVVASRVITEAGPVPAELRRRRARLHRGVGAAANGEEAYERKHRKEPDVHPEIVPDRPYRLALVL